MGQGYYIRNGYIPTFIKCSRHIIINLAIYKMPIIALHSKIEVAYTSLQMAATTYSYMILTTFIILCIFCANIYTLMIVTFMS